jgi:hypothetical protein
MRDLALSIAAASFAALLPAGVLADAQCSGHQLLSKSRPEASCRSVVPEIFVSPDKTMRAVVLPADVSLDTTPDMESRVAIRSSNGDTLTSKEFVGGAQAPLPRVRLRTAPWWRPRTFHQTI